ncbi:MAG: hypothetical protein JSW33_05960 [bacterium]|nr:MAG: hypothetical protein JSW33_05960 [bacterium]
MESERRKILEMLSNGTISVDEAERLLKALSESPDSNSANTDAPEVGKPKYLRVLVEPAAGNRHGERVNIRVPLNLIRAGLKWAAFIPEHAQVKLGKAFKEKGISADLSKLSPEDLEDLILNLNDLEVEVEGEEVIKVFCE